MFRHTIVLLLLLATSAYAHTDTGSGFATLLQDPESRILDISDHLYDGQFDAAETELARQTPGK